MPDAPATRARPLTLVMATAAAAAVLCVAARPQAFSLGAAPSRLDLPRRGEAARASKSRLGIEARAPAALGIQEDTEGIFASGSQWGGATFTAAKGLSLALLSVVALGDTPKRRYRRTWRRLVRSAPGGRLSVRRDKRPALFGPEKPPHEVKKIYHYYCNKMYKVIRESTGSVDVPPLEEESAHVEEGLQQAEPARRWPGLRALAGVIRRALAGRSGGQ
mmetsp:Transcript_112961/g.300084  ORF Transcript_112961/g.300084 Transcript_112961/m.300084 type:complete len:219 (-) Transcript_112961:59-715(-)